MKGGGCSSVLKRGTRVLGTTLEIGWSTREKDPGTRDSFEENLDYKTSVVGNDV